MTSRVHTIKFDSFMDGSYKKIPNRVKAYSFVSVSPLAFLDPNIITFGAVILGIALAEKHLEKIGLYDVAEKIEGIIKFALPVGAFSYLTYFILHL